MRNIIFKLAVLAAVFVSTIACGQKKNVPESLVGIKEIVAQIDSAVNAIYGWEPRDSTHDASVDTLVANIMREHETERPEHNIGMKSAASIEQSAYDDARKTWAEFKRLCDQEEYEAALDFYLADKPNDGGSKAGDFLLYLKHSSHRFYFFSEVLLPLMQEYKGTEFARKEYIDLLQLEKALEDTSIAIQADGNGYIPDVYPYLIRELGLALTADGKLNEALDLADDLMNVVYQVSGEALYANFVGTQYAAKLYLYLDDKEKAISTWEDFKRFLNDTADDYPADILKEVQAQIQEQIELINE